MPLAERVGELNAIESSTSDTGQCTELSRNLGVDAPRASTLEARAAEARASLR